MSSPEIASCSPEIRAFTVWPSGPPNNTALTITLKHRQQHVSNLRNVPVSRILEHVVLAEAIAAHGLVIGKTHSSAWFRWEWPANRHLLRASIRASPQPDYTENQLHYG